MTKEKIQLGRQGEEAAVVFLEANGYKILEKNFKTSLGEIDLIASDDGILCFIEVKTRTTQKYGSGFEAVSKFKQHKLSKLALFYLKGKKLLHRKARFDIVSVEKTPDGEGEIKLLQNAFELSSRYGY